MPISPSYSPLPTRKLGKRSISAFIIADRRNQLYRDMTKVEDKLGQHCSDTAQIDILTTARVPLKSKNA